MQLPQTITQKRESFLKNNGISKKGYFSKKRYQIKRLEDFLKNTRHQNSKEKNDFIQNKINNKKDKYSDLIQLNGNNLEIANLQSKIKLKSKLIADAVFKYNSGVVNSGSKKEEFELNYLKYTILELGKQQKELKLKMKKLLGK